MTKLDIEAIKARAEAATEGPWEVSSEGPGYPVGIFSRLGTKSARTVIYPDDDYETGEPDLEFIAHAREDIPALLTYIDELEAQIERVRLEAKAEAFMDAQQIIAGEDPIDEMRYHDGSKVSIGYTIREIDAEIRELALGGDGE